MTPYKSYRMGYKKVQAAVTKPSQNISTMMPVRSLVYLPLKYNKHFNRVLKSTNDKPLLLLADHHMTEGYAVYLGLHINTLVTLNSKRTGIHPVTGLATAEVSIGTRQIVGVFELGNLTDERSLVVERSIYYLAESVGLNDKINGKTIKTIRNISGLYRVEVN
jgi:hypothetical protein